MVWAAPAAPATAATCREDSRGNDTGFQVVFRNDSYHKNKNSLHLSDKLKKEIDMMKDKTANGASDADSVLKRHLSAAHRRKRKRVITTTVVIVLVLAAIAVGVFTLRDSVAERYGAAELDVESFEVAVDSISTTLSGSGTLVDDDVEEVEVPSAVEIDTVFVEEGDTVEEGDMIASLNTASIVSAMADLQDQIDEIDAELEEVSDDKVDSRIIAGISGRVKKIFTGAGDDIATVMYENGSLMLISLDGLMAVDIDTQTDIAAGDAVTVTLSDDSDIDGTVQSVKGSTATVTVTDNGTVFGDAVTVLTENGDILGTGTLYIHNEIKVTGYAGTVRKVYVNENTKVTDSTKLLYLTDTSYTANYDTLLKERASLEEDLDEMITLYKEGALYSPISGAVYTVDYDADDEAKAESANAESVEDTADTPESTDTDDEYTTIATVSLNATMSVTVDMDESNILSLEEGQEAVVTIDSIGDDEFTGTVTAVNTSSTSSGGVTVFTIEVTIDKTDQMLAGMSASVVIKTDSVENVLVVPEDALEQTSDMSYVYTEYDQETGELSGIVEVETGLSNGTYVQIISGLSQGDTVYYEESAAETINDRGFGGMGGEMPGMPGGNMPQGRPGGQ